MNNKQSHFRARVIDFTKPMTIYREDEVAIHQLQPAVTRMMQDIPTGMEKNEEKELHLQQAIDGGCAIPVPEVEKVKYELSPYTMPKQLIQTHPFPLDEEGPEYDADSEDERFLRTQSGISVDIDVFERMIAAFENGSTRKALTLEEAKSLFPDDIVITMTVYEYWLNKRLRSKYPLIATIPTESRLTKNQAYVAFRKRIDKRITRRNRRNDENSYYRMLQLKKDLETVVLVLELIKQREAQKKELIKVEIDLLDSRYKHKEFSDIHIRNILREESILVHSPVVQPKRKYSKQRKQKIVSDRKTDEDENNPFAFRRKLGCSYLPPVSGALTRWPDDDDRFIPGTVDGRKVILVRKRLGRGGRIILDRRIPPYNFYVDSNILTEIQSNAVGHFKDFWSIDVEDEDSGIASTCELEVPDVMRSEEREVVRPRGKKSFTDHLNEIRYRHEGTD